MRSLALFFALVLVPASRADQLCVATSTPLAPTNWNTSVLLPRFDPALGTLNTVDVCVTGQMLSDYNVESPDTAPETVTGYVQVRVILDRPDTSVILLAMPSVVFVDNLGAFDGTIDFRGASGAMHPGVSAIVTTQVFLTGASDLALFSGTAGSPGTITLPVHGEGAGAAAGAGHILTQFIDHAAAMISICYDYTPVAAPYCAGDGTGTACPCGNGSPVGAFAGCLHSFATGAVLRGTGFASVASDSLVLACSSLPATTTGLFFQGDVALASGAQFGDGLRCVGGNVVRLATKTAAGGVAHYPQSGDQPISVRGSVPAGSMRYYQLWFRNAVSFCTSDPFNLSAGVAVSWTP
jgi:hypothetical protein